MTPCVAATRPLPRGTCLGRTNPHCQAPRHGTISAYRYGCRCPHAREADRIYQKRRREHRHTPRRVDDTGTRRRLHALAAIGWRWRDIADQLGGMTWQAAQQLAVRHRGGTVAAHTAARVRAVYDQLWDTPGPSNITRLRAAAKGWPPPQAWDDDEIDNPDARPDLGGPGRDVIDEVRIERALDGQRVPLTTAEREHAFRVGLARGMTVTAVTTALHMGGGHGRTIADRVLQPAA